MGVTEKHQKRLALHIGIGDALAVLILKLKRAANRGDSLPDWRRRIAGHDQYGCKKQEEAR
jgi:hypothetical protein